MWIEKNIIPIMLLYTPSVSTDYASFYYLTRLGMNISEAYYIQTRQREYYVWGNQFYRRGGFCPKYHSSKFAPRKKFEGNDISGQL